MMFVTRWFLKGSQRPLVHEWCPTGASTWSPVSRLHKPEKNRAVFFWGVRIPIWLLAFWTPFLDIHGIYIILYIYTCRNVGVYIWYVGNIIYDILLVLQKIYHLYLHLHEYWIWCMHHMQCTNKYIDMWYVCVNVGILHKKFKSSK